MERANYRFVKAQGSRLLLEELLDKETLMLLRCLKWLDVVACTSHPSLQQAKACELEASPVSVLHGEILFQNKSRQNKPKCSLKNKKFSTVMQSSVFVCLETICTNSIYTSWLR